MVLDVTPESEYLRRLARRVAVAYLAHAHPRAVLLTGSAAVGDADRYSDLNLVLYYDLLPSEKALEAAHAELGVDEVTVLSPEPRREFGQAYQLEGVECQVGHATVAAWEEDMASVLRGLDVTSPVQSALAGLLQGIVLYGDELIQQWQEEAAAYPKPLARAMVEHYLRFFPLWAVADRLARRDATIWIYATLVASAQHILGVLAGLNRLYYYPVQFKRTHRFVAGMSFAPERLADRLDALFGEETARAIEDVEQLAVEAVALVREHMSEVNTTGQPPLVGDRAAMWTPRALDAGEGEAAGEMAGDGESEKETGDESGSAHVIEGDSDADA